MLLGSLLLTTAVLVHEMPPAGDVAPGNIVVVGSCTELMDMDYIPTAVRLEMQDYKMQAVRAENGFWFTFGIAVNTYTQSGFYLSFNEMRFYACIDIKHFKEVREGM